jgi:hypothetical protein
MTNNGLLYNSTEIARDFHLSNARVRLLLGPVGCGKSVAGCVEVFRRGLEQEPGFDGVRRSRWAIIRNTYPELKKTTIKTWEEWFPPHIYGSVNWSSPPTHRIQMPLEDGTLLDLEVIFLALDGPGAIGKLMSFELTGIYINEMQFIHPKVFEICNQRINRYPAKKSGAKITWTGILADTNPPSTRHWIYPLFAKNRPENYELFTYKPALLKVAEIPKDGKRYAISRDGTIYINNGDADYLSNLPDIYYYLDQVPGSDDERIKVFMLGEWGIIVDGRPVHPEYKDRFHYADRELAANDAIEVGLGWDFGLTPAVAIVQFTPRGQLNVIDELYCDYMGLRDFVENIVLPHLDRHYPFWRTNYVSRHDPAGQTGAQTDAKNCQQILAEFGIQSQAAATSNSPTPRRDGLKYHLRRIVDGDAGFLLSNRCQQIREGLMGQYQYGRIKTALADGTEQYHDKPLKNEFSHICEGLEYIAMYYARTEKVAANQSKHSHIIQNLMNHHNHIQHLKDKASWQR